MKGKFLKIASAILVLVMVLTSVTTTVFAQEKNVYENIKSVINKGNNL